MSNSLHPCCLKTNFHEGTPTGSHSNSYGLDTYQVGAPNKNVIVIFTDIFGNHYNNVLLIADEIASHGYHVLIPDILQGQTIEQSSGPVKWLEDHTLEDTDKICDDFLRAVRTNLKPAFLGTIGYCFGARFCVRQLAKGRLADAAAVAHPSLTLPEEYKAISKPLLLSLADDDEYFTIDQRYELEKDYAGKNVRYQVDLFSGTQHGFASRGDTKDPVVKYAMSKTIIDQVLWFKSIHS